MNFPGHVSTSSMGKSSWKASEMDEMGAQQWQDAALATWTGAVWQHGLQKFRGRGDAGLFSGRDFLRPHDFKVIVFFHTLTCYDL